MATNSSPQELDPENVGINVESSYEKTLRLRVKELLNCTNENFPGTLPVNLDTARLSLLEQEDYFVCEKSDGVRYLMLSVHTAKGPATFLIDRSNSYHYIDSLLLPDKDNHSKFHHETLLDGELVISKDKETNQKTLLFLVFDLMVFNSTIITQRPFSSRLGLLRQEIIEPFEMYLKSKPEIAKRLPFFIVLKRVERSYGLKLVLSTLPMLEYDSDGLIFTPVFSPYKSGTCSKLLQWKPPELNTVDLRIHVSLNADRKPVYQLQAAAGAALKIISPLQLSQDLYAKWRSAPPEGKIGEFRWDPHWPVTTAEKGYAPQTVRGGWIFLRLRPDKKAPHDETAAKKAMRAVEEGVTRETLEEFSDGIRTHWKERERLNDANAQQQRPEEAKVELAPSKDANSSQAHEPINPSEFGEQVDSLNKSEAAGFTQEPEPKQDPDPALPHNSPEIIYEREASAGTPAEEPQSIENSIDAMEVDPQSEPAVGSAQAQSQDPPTTEDAEESLVLPPLLSRALDEEKRAASAPSTEPSAEMPLRLARRLHSDSNLDTERLAYVQPLRQASPPQGPAGVEVLSQPEPGPSAKKPRLKVRPSVEDGMESASPLPAPPSSEAPTEVPMEIDPPLAPKRTSSLFALMSPELPVQEPVPHSVLEPAQELVHNETPLFARPVDPRLSSETKSNSSSASNSLPPAKSRRRSTKPRKTLQLAHLLNGNPQDPSSGEPSNTTPPVLAPSPMRVLTPPLMRPSPQPRQPFEPPFRPPYFPPNSNGHSRGDPPYIYHEMHLGQPRFIPNPQGLPQGLPQGHPSYPPMGTLSGPQAGAYIFGTVAPGARPLTHPVLTPQQLTGREASLRRGSFGMPYYKPYPEPGAPELARLPMSTGLPHNVTLRRSSLSQAAWGNGRPEPYPPQPHMQNHPGHGPKYAMAGYPGRPMQQQNAPLLHRPIAAHPASNPPPASGVRPRPFSGPPGYPQTYLSFTSPPYQVGLPPTYAQGYAFQGPSQMPPNTPPHPSNQPMHHQPLVHPDASPRPSTTPGQPAASTPSARQSKGMLDFIMNP